MNSRSTEETRDKPKDSVTVSIPPISGKGRAAVIIPVFNEESHLAEVLSSLPREVVGVPLDVVVVNDGSTDTSASIAKDARCVVISHPERRGYGMAVQAGLYYARDHEYDFAIKMDGDGQHDARYAGTIVKILKRGGVDLVTSSRYLRRIDALSAAPLDRKLVNTMVTGAINRVTGRSLTDVFCGIFGLTGSFLKTVSLEAQDYGIELELILQAHFQGASMLEIPHPLIYHEKGGSKFAEVYGLDDHLAQRLERYTRIILRTLSNLKIESF